MHRLIYIKKIYHNIYYIVSLTLCIFAHQRINTFPSVFITFVICRNKSLKVISENLNHSDAGYEYNRKKMPTIV